MSNTSPDHKQRLRAPTPYKGGIGCVEYHARRYIELELTEPQAAALWLELEAYLKSRGLGETVREMKEAGTGSLDTLPRGDVLEAIAKTLTGGEFAWPCNGDAPGQVESFAAAMRAGIASRGYEFISAQPNS